MAAHHHLRQVLYAVNLAAMAYPEVYLPNAASLFDSEGRLASAETRAFLTQFLQAFDDWVGKVRK
jgi:chromate reductase